MTAKYQISVGKKKTVFPFPQSLYSVEISIWWLTHVDSASEQLCSQCHIRGYSFIVSYTNIARLFSAMITPFYITPNFLMESQKFVAVISYTSQHEGPMKQLETCTLSTWTTSQ